ncbi:glycosyltransferase, partial [Thermodesulfobacteriota bacterium]
MKKQEYSLITAARNEEKYIGSTIEAVISQTIKPLNWIIVSDCSTDNTDSIVNEYVDKYPFIRLERIDRDGHRDFASKSNALNLAFNKITNNNVDYVGNLDADITFKNNYYEEIITKFEENPYLGIGGGFIHEKYRGKFRSRSNNRTESVAGAVQLFRRKCYIDIGGYPALKYGGEDWYMEVTARMLGWECKSFRDITAYHHKLVANTLKAVIDDRIQDGRRDYTIGSHIIFEIIKSIGRWKDRPILLATLLRIFGYINQGFQNDQ